MSARAKKIVVLEYQNGMYQGHSLNKSREGLGVFLWDSGDFYFGEWKNDTMHGQGIIFFSYGGYAKGNFSKNKLEGKAMLKFPNGDQYDAVWDKGRLHGVCSKHFIHEQSVIVCEYSQGVFIKTIEQQTKSREQSSTQDFANTFSYSAIVSKYSIGKNIQDLDFSYNKFKDGGFFLGITLNKIPNGLGIMVYSDWKFDSGNYKNGFLQGFGRLNYPNGDIYDGIVNNGLLDGEGVFYKKSHNKYIFGNFSQNNCVQVFTQGYGFPKETMEIVKYHYHAINQNFIDKFFTKNVFEIPQLKQESFQSSENSKGSSQSIIQNVSFLQSPKQINNNKAQRSNGQQRKQIQISHECGNGESHLYNLLNSLSQKKNTNETELSINENSLKEFDYQIVDQRHQQIVAEKKSKSIYNNNYNNNREGKSTAQDNKSQFKKSQSCQKFCKEKENITPLSNSSHQQNAPTTQQQQQQQQNQQQLLQQLNSPTQYGSNNFQQLRNKFDQINSSLRSKERIGNNSNSNSTINNGQSQDDQKQSITERFRTNNNVDLVDSAVQVSFEFSKNQMKEYLNQMQLEENNRNCINHTLSERQNNQSSSKQPPQLKQQYAQNSLNTIGGNSQNVNNNNIAYQFLNQVSDISPIKLDLDDQSQANLIQRQEIINQQTQQQFVDQNTNNLIQKYNKKNVGTHSEYETAFQQLQYNQNLLQQLSNTETPEDDIIQYSNNINATKNNGELIDRYRTNLEKIEEREDEEQNMFSPSRKLDTTTSTVNKTNIDIQKLEHIKQLYNQYFKNGGKKPLQEVDMNSSDLQLDDQTLKYILDQIHVPEQVMQQQCSIF